MCFSCFYCVNSFMLILFKHENMSFLGWSSAPATALQSLSFIAKAFRHVRFTSVLGASKKRVIQRSIRRYKYLRTEVDRSGRGIHVSVTTTRCQKGMRKNSQEAGASISPNVTTNRHQSDFDEKNLPRNVPQEEKRTYKQDGVSTYKARIVQNWCKDNFPDFISFDEWQPTPWI